MLDRALLLALLFFLGCKGNPNGSESDPKTANEGGNHASRMKIEDRPYGYLLHIRKEGNGKMEKYQLVEREKASDPQKGSKKRIEVPVERIACLSSTHLGMLLALGESERLVAFSRKKHLFDEDVRKRMEQGKIESIGMKRSLDKERLVSTDASLLLHDGMGKGNNAGNEQLTSAGISEIPLQAWKEKHPLGRAEWIRVFGILTGKKDKADSIYRSRSKAYDSLASIASKAEGKPKILSNAPHKGTWYVPGGASYKSRLIQDAGGKNPWIDTKKAGGIPRSLEEVLNKAGNADIWIEPGRAKKLEDLQEMDERMGHFKAYQEGAVYNNDRRKAKRAGNDFWESGPVNPQLVLADLIEIFHPELLPDQELHYYRKLPEKSSS